MQASGTVREAPMIPPRRRLKVLLAAVVVVATMVVLVALAGIIMVRGGEARNIPLEPAESRVTLYDNEGIAHQVHARARGMEQHAPWVTLYDDKGDAHQVRVR